MSDSDPHEPPDPLEACWDRDRIASLFADLQLGAVVTRVQVRTQTDQHLWNDASVTLEQARELLDDGRATAIQIYYDFDGTSWCDTLFPQPDSVRIVRTVVPPPH